MTTPVDFLRQLVELVKSENFARLRRQMERAIRRLQRADSAEAARYMLAQRRRWKPADGDTVRNALPSRLLPVVRRHLIKAAAEGRRGRPVLDRTKARGRLAELAAWGAMPEATPRERQAVMRRSPLWPRMAAEAYCGERARLKSLGRPAKGAHEEAEANVAAVFGVSAAI